MKKKLLSTLLMMSMIFGMFAGFIPARIIAVADENSKLIEASDVPLRLYYDEEASHGVAAGYDDVDTYFGSGSDLIAKHPNDDWERWSIPLGNGYFGANIFGRTGAERIQLTEKTLANPYRISGSSTYTDGLNNFSETYIDFGHTTSSVSNYSRELDLKTAISTVNYTYGGVNYSREYFTSYPDRAMVIKLDASATGALSFVLRPTIPYEQEYMNTADDGGGKTGTVTSSVTNGVGSVVLSGTLEYFDVDFVGLYKVYTNGGTVTATTCTNADGDTDGTITVSGATSAYIVITMGTDYELCEDTFTQSRLNKPTFKTDLDDAMAKVQGYMTAIENKISGKSFGDAYALLKANHLADYQELFGRVSLDLNFNESDFDLTTDQLLTNYKNGSGSTYLEALYFQYGRYLLIASSRSGALPANLQGAWNRYNHSPWSSGYWHNINVQMNYWPAFSTNLSETFEAYVEYNDAYMAKAEQGATGVVNSYNPSVSGTDGGNGWSIETGGYVNDINPSTSIGNLGFTTQLFWEYYEYTKDINTLREVVYPVLVSAARFITKMVKEDADGNYIAIYTDSPEQYVNGVWYYTDQGTAYAQTFAYQNNYNTLLAAKELGIDFGDTSHEDYAILQTVMEQLDKYDPIRVGLSGQVKEFFEEEYYGDMGEYTHRHISQLVGLYPGNVINSTTPAWMDAAEYVLTERGDNATGWGVAHRLNLWARVQNGERAYDLLEQLLKVNTATNLWDLHPPFQIDGNLGGTAGISEMLLQSHAGYIEPLAAIPSAWSTGSYTGLVARGNFEVAAAWADGVATTFNITSKSGGSVSVKYSGIGSANLFDENGKAVSYTVTDKDIITFDTEAGKTYIISNFTKQTKPSKVSGLNIESEFLGKSTLTWTASGDAVAYNVYVAKESDSDYTLLATTKNTSYVYTPGELENLRLTFAVTAVNSQGVESNRALVYRNPDDVSSPVESISANVIDGELQVAVKSNEYAGKYKLYSRATSVAEWTLVQESTYPIIIDKTYDSTLKYGISVTSLFGVESEITTIMAFNQAFDEVDYKPTNIFAGIEMLPGNDGYGYRHTNSGATTAFGYYSKLTDGDFGTSTGRFSTSNSNTAVLEGTLSLPTVFLLGELKIYDFNGYYSTANYVGTHLTVEVAVDGVWTEVAEYNSNAEILALRKSDTNGNYIAVDLSLVKAQQVRIRIDTPVTGNSISLNEIQCTGIALNQGKTYSDNLLLGKEFYLTSDCYTWEATGSDSDGAIGLTDGTYRYSENPLLWRTWYNKDYMKFDATVDFGGEAILNELRLFYYNGQWGCAAPNIKIYYFYDGEWTLLHDIAIDSTSYLAYKREGTIDTSSTEQWLAIDLEGVKAEKLRICMPPKTDNAYGFYEITLDGYYELDGSTYSENLFRGLEFVPTAAAAAKVWNPYTYDKLTDGKVASDDRLNTSGTASFVDATLSFDGIVAEVDYFTINYGTGWGQVRSGTGLIIDVLGESGAWTEVLNVTYDTVYQGKVTYNLGGKEAIAIRIRVPGVYPEAIEHPTYGSLAKGDSIAIMEIECAGSYIQSDKEYSENMLLGKAPVSTDTNATITSNTYGVYGFDKLTDGDMGLHTGRFAVNALQGNYATVTYDLGGNTILETLKIWDHIDGKTVARSNETTIELLVNGNWVKYMDAQPLWTDAASTVVSGSTRCVSFDLSGNIARQIRITFKNTQSGYTDGVTFYEISLSGYSETNPTEYTDDVFTGLQFVPTDSTASANIWSPNTYDKITDDGAVNDSSKRFATANGHTADGTLDFEGKVMELYTLTVNFDPYTATRCGQDFNIYVYRNGEWRQVLSHVHTEPVLVETFDLGGVEAEKVRFTVTSKYAGGANADGKTGDCIIIYEMSCTGFILPPEEVVSEEDASSNILLGTTADKLTVTGATVHSGAAIKDLTNAFDGKTNTRYAVFDKSPYSYSLEIELSATYPLYTLGILPFFNQNEASRSDNTSVDVYLDGVWVRVASGVVIKPANEYTKIDLGGIKASKIRINFANTTWSASATIYEITCTTGATTAIDRSALLEAYKALDELDVSATHGIEEAKNVKLDELKSLLMNTEATQSDIDSYVGTVADAVAKYESAESLVTDSYGDFSSYNLSLAGDIGFNFYGELSASVATEFPDAFVVVEYTKYENKTATVVTEKVLVSDLNTVNSKTVLTLDLPAAQMTDTVKIRLVLDGDNVGRYVEQTIRSYADKILADNAYASSHNIIKAMLNYGGAAQTYFGYNTGNLANAGIDAATITGSTVNAGTLVTSGSLTGITPAGWSLALDSNVNMRFYFSTQNISRYAFRVTSPDGGTVDILPELMDDGTYRVEIKTTDAKLMDDTYRLVVEDISSATSISITVNAMKYVERMVSGAINGNQALKALGEAMRLYCIAANEYNA